MPEKTVVEVIAQAGLPLIAASIGGVLDFVTQVRAGIKTWSIIGFLLHVASAMFFGWVLGQLAINYFTAPGTYNAWAGLGGFLGTRVIDFLFSLKVKR